MTRAWGRRWVGRLRRRVCGRGHGTSDGGFILLESVIAITVITIVMAAVGVEFVGGVTAVSQQRAQQVAVQVANSTVEQIRSLHASDLVTGRDNASSKEQFALAGSAVQPWLANMDGQVDLRREFPDGSGLTAAVPTRGVEQKPGPVSYTVNQYLGRCRIQTSRSTDCVNPSTVSIRTSMRYLRAVVAVTWTGPRCGRTLCTYVTSTLISEVPDRTFPVNAGAYPAPVIKLQPAQNNVIDDVVNLQMSVREGTGVPPLSWKATGLPDGLTITETGTQAGLIVGTVKGPQTSYNVTVTVMDAFLRTDEQQFTWNVTYPPLEATQDDQVSNVSVALAPPLQLRASGGSGTYTWSDATPRSLPAGLSLDGGTGLITGTPTVVGTSTVALTVASGGSTKTVRFVWRVLNRGASYDFEEGAGTTAADGTGNGNTATLQPGGRRWTTGKVNLRALNLTGASDSWAASAGPVVDTSQSFTVASWVKLNSLNGYQTIAGMDGTSVSPFYLQRNAAGRFTFEVYRSDNTSGSVGAVQGLTPTTDAWYHVAGVFDQAAGTTTLYVDGVSQGTLTGATVFRATGPTTIGRGKYGGANTDFVNGALDDTRFYDRPLTSAEVATLASGGAAGPTGGSVDATGLVGTGLRYSASTTLNLALAKGTDPDGVASTGAQLSRATAPLTTGSCGAYGAYTQVGANDPGTPLATTVADGACYRYRYRVVDSLGNTSTYGSPDIKVDTTAPPAPDLVFSSPTNAFASASGSGSGSGSGSMIYYRPGAASGGFTVTASSTDPVAGIAGYAFPGLGTGWTSTAGAQGVNAYSWAATNPATPGNRVVTATNNAGGSSVGTALTITPDSSAPTTGTVTYPDRSSPSTSVSISFSTGSDTGSGVGTRLLQRASASLTGSTCGTYTGFTTVQGGTNPTSPFVDTVTLGNCYKYQYLVSDNVGNTGDPATSANVVKVRSTYAETVVATAGLLNWFRLGEATLSSDSFTDVSQTVLPRHTGELGTGWTTYQSTNEGSARISSANRLYRSANETSTYYTSAVPAGANYSVEADLVFRSNITNDFAGVIGRVNASTSAFYGARWETGANGGSWVLYKSNNGTLTTLATTSAATRTANQTNRIRLEMIGTAIKLYVDGVLTTSATDAAISAAGRAGISDGNPSALITKTDTTGIQFDNFSVGPVPRAADSKGNSVGDYFGGVVLGVVGAIAGDANTAATFDGINDYTSVPRTIQDDFAIEFWFKSTGGRGTNAQWWDGAGMVDAEVGGSTNDFGVSLRSDGRVVAGVGNPDTSIVSPPGYNNGAWHHVVFNRTKASGALQLFVDGALVGSATSSNTASLTSSATISFGRIATGVNYLAGSLDEIALYSAVLSQATVTSHYNAGQPAG